MTAKKTGRYDRKKNKLGMTVKKQAPGMTGREKMLRYDKKKETLWHGRREKKCRLGQERINSKIP